MEDNVWVFVCTHGRFGEEWKSADKQALFYFGTGLASK